VTSSSFPSSVDVAVVGAGPAGSSAAIEAVRAGATTLILDRSQFPRYKTCGGGLIGPTLRSLPAGLEIPVRQEIVAASFTNKGRAARDFRTGQPALVLVDRADFDDLLLSRAIGEGAIARLGTAVSSLREETDAVFLQTPHGEIRARYVVGADGSASRVARYAGVSLSQVDLGLEVELDSAGAADDWRGRIHLDWGAIPGSYGWVFPKGRILTVGVIARKGQPGETRKYLAEFIKARGLDGLPAVRESGHLTRCRTPDSPLGRGRVLVCGDAAGLLEPWTREGISFAVRSGMLAGQVAAQAALDGASESAAPVLEYTNRINSSLAPEMAAGARFLTAFERHPAVMHAAVARTPAGWNTFVRITRGDTTLARIIRHRSARLALGILAGRSGRQT
jgi:geranylgeranyl reductase family protein